MCVGGANEHMCRFAFDWMGTKSSYRSVFNRLTMLSPPASPPPAKENPKDSFNPRAVNVPKLWRVFVALLGTSNHRRLTVAYLTNGVRKNRAQGESDGLHIHPSTSHTAMADWAAELKKLKEDAKRKREAVAGGDGGNDRSKYIRRSDLVSASLPTLHFHARHISHHIEPSEVEVIRRPHTIKIQGHVCSSPLTHSLGVFYKT